MAIDRERTGLLAVGLAAVCCAACKEPPPPAPPAPPEVYVASVVQKDVPVYLEVVGQATGFQDVEIRARVEGFLETMDYEEGQFVKRGALLYTIDRKPLQAVVAASIAERDTAQARLDKANNDVARYTPLAAKQAVSQQELDNARAAQDAAKSQVEAAKAAVDKASFDLGYTRVTSPISGLAGTTLMKPGNLVGRGESTLLTTISQIDPILFRIGVSEAEYLRYARRATARTGGDPRGGGFQLTLSDGSVYPHTGKVNTVDRAVDPATGTLGIQLEFANPNLLLRPGQYGKVRLLLENKAQALLIPQRAVQELQSIRSVAVVDDSGMVSFRTVKVGQKVDSLWVIEEGLKLGDRVVVEGLQRVQDGTTVVAKAAPASGDPGATPTSGSSPAEGK